MRIDRILLLILAIFLFSCSISNPHIKSITTGDIKHYLKHAPKASEHPNAGANILYNYNHFEFFDDGTSVNRIVERIKIFNERGRRLASKTIYYREGYQSAKILFANTIRPNGEIIPLNIEDIQDTSSYAGYELYTDIRQKRFTMPAVEDNCIIEYAYEIKTLKPILSFDFFATFFCKEYNPIEVDIMEIVLPKNVELKYKKFNTSLTPEIIDNNNKKKYILTNLKQKEIVPESRMPEIMDRNTFSQLVFWTLSDWETISKWYNNLIWEQAIPDKELIEFTKNLIADKKTDEEKIKAIFNFVAQRVRYVAVLLGSHTHQPHHASEIFRKRYGDCKDKTTLLLTMLKIAGIKALPALVPSFPEYFDETMPSLKVFNHVIAVVKHDDKYFWLDATNEAAAYNSVPFFRPAKVFIINIDGSYKFVQTPDMDKKKDYYLKQCKYKIDNEGNADIEAVYTYSGKTAESIRYFYKYLPPEQRKKYFEKKGITVNELHLSSFTETEKPFTVELKGYAKNVAHKLDDDLMVLSDIINFDTYRDITSAVERKYPVSLSASFFSRKKLSFVLPTGFKIRKLPCAYSLYKPFMKHEEKYSFKKNTLTVYVEQKSFKYIIGTENLEDFKKIARKLQKHQSSVKNFILEKK